MLLLEANRPRLARWSSSQLGILRCSSPDASSVVAGSFGIAPRHFGLDQKQLPSNQPQIDANGYSSLPTIRTFRFSSHFRGAKPMKVRPSHTSAGFAKSVTRHALIALLIPLPRFSSDFKLPSCLPSGQASKHLCASRTCSSPWREETS